MSASLIYNGTEPSQLNQSSAKPASNLPSSPALAVDVPIETALSRFYFDHQQLQLITQVMASTLIRAVEPHGSLDNFQHALEGLAIEHGHGTELIREINDLAHFLEQGNKEVSDRLVNGESLTNILPDFPVLQKFATDHGFFPGSVQNLEQLNHERWQAIMFLRENKQYAAVSAIAEDTLGETLIANNGKIDLSSLTQSERDIWKAYNDCVDPNHATLNLQDKTNDSILDASVGTLPWVVAAVPINTVAGFAMEGAARAALGISRNLIGRVVAEEGAEVLSDSILSTIGKNAIARWAGQNTLRRSLVGIGEGQLAVGLAPAVGIGLSAAVRDVVVNAKSGNFFWRDDRPLQAFLARYLEQAVFQYTGALSGLAFTAGNGARTALGQWVDAHASTALGRSLLEFAALKSHAQSAALLATSAALPNSEFHQSINELGPTGMATEIIRAYTTVSALSAGQGLVEPTISAISRNISSFSKDPASAPASLHSRTAPDEPNTTRHLRLPWTEPLSEVKDPIIAPMSLWPQLKQGVPVSLPPQSPFAVSHLPSPPNHRAYESASLSAGGSTAGPLSGKILQEAPTLRASSGTGSREDGLPRPTTLVKLSKLESDYLELLRAGRIVEADRLAEDGAIAASLQTSAVAREAASSGLGALLKRGSFEAATELAGRYHLATYSKGDPDRLILSAANQGMDVALSVPGDKETYSGLLPVIRMFHLDSEAIALRNIRTILTSGLRALSRLDKTDFSGRSDIIRTASSHALAVAEGLKTPPLKLKSVTLEFFDAAIKNPTPANMAYAQEIAAKLGAPVRSRNPIIERRLRGWLETGQIENIVAFLDSKFPEYRLSKSLYESMTAKIAEYISGYGQNEERAILLAKALGDFRGRYKEQILANQKIADAARERAKQLEVPSIGAGSDGRNPVLAVKLRKAFFPNDSE